MTSHGVDEGISPAAFAAPYLSVSSGATEAECTFAKLVSQHYQRLVDLASTLAGPDDAVDIVQDALLLCWQRLSDAETPFVARNMHGFLYQLVSDTAKKAVQRRDRRFRRLHRVGAGVSHFVATHISSPFISGVRRWMHTSHEVEATDTVAALSRAVERLTPKARKVFLLSWKQGLNAAEIGELLQMGEGTVRVAMWRACRTLRESLERDAASAAPASQPNAPQMLRAPRGHTLVGRTDA